MVSIGALLHVIQHKCKLRCHFSQSDCGMHLNICTLDPGCCPRPHFELDSLSRRKKTEYLYVLQG